MLASAVLFFCASMPMLVFEVIPADFVGLLCKCFPVKQRDEIQDDLNLVLVYNDFFNVEVDQLLHLVQRLRPEHLPSLLEISFQFLLVRNFQCKCGLFLRDVALERRLLVPQLLHLREDHVTLLSVHAIGKDVGQIFQLRINPTCLIFQPPERLAHLFVLLAEIFLELSDDNAGHTVVEDGPLYLLHDEGLDVVPVHLAVVADDAGLSRLLVAAVGDIRRLVPRGRFAIARIGAAALAAENLARQQILSRAK